MKIINDKNYCVSGREYGVLVNVTNFNKLVGQGDVVQGLILFLVEIDLSLIKNGITVEVNVIRRFYDLIKDHVLVLVTYRV